MVVAVAAISEAFAALAHTCDNFAVSAINTGIKISSTLPKTLQPPSVFMRYPVRTTPKITAAAATSIGAVRQITVTQPGKAIVEFMEESLAVAALSRVFHVKNRGSIIFTSGSPAVDEELVARAAGMIPAPGQQPLNRAALNALAQATQALLAASINSPTTAASPRRHANDNASPKRQRAPAEEEEVSSEGEAGSPIRRRFN
eukprot:TRINITY_DN8645_c1_g1_i1.p1 TRINITY_DN8645_c1_g1~~TRINITY_DN8645_c1_g1_i1.p1  ORF type:complete len:202 (+),score=25.34 TRINITY_DN8645_c1_g1_i1:395-1000(+)